jgi:hypothetical protein
MKHAGGWAYRTKEERKAYDHERYMRQREQRLRRMAAYREEHREELNAKKRKRYTETIWAKYDKT